jgi:hypothetical protein
MKMIRLLFLALAIITGLTVSAQVGIGVNFANVDPSAELDVSSTTKGFLVPRMTSSQRLNIVSPASGLLLYQTNAPICFYYYSEGNWKLLEEQNISLKLNVLDTAVMLSSYARVQRVLDSLNSKLSKADTASMLSSYAQIHQLLDSLLSVQSKLNLKLNISDSALMLDSRFAKDTISLSNRIYTNKQAIKDTASNLRSYANLKVNIADTANMLDSRFAKDTVSLSTRININKQAIKDTASNLRTYANLKVNITDTANMLDSRFAKDTVSLSTRINTNKQAMKDSASNLRIYANLKVNIADTANMLDNRFARDTASLSARIDEKLNISDTSTMLDNRFARDTASLSARIDEKLNISDTSTMLDNRFARDTASLSSRINLKLSSADTASLSMRIDSLRPMSSGDIVYGGTDGVPTRLSIGDDGQVLTLTNGLPIWTANNGITTVGPISATATATGAYIASNTLYLAPADADNAGIVSTATQTFVGEKTFNSDLTVNGKITSSNTDRSTFAGKLTVGTNSDTTSSAVLEASSTTQGFLPPRLTTTQRDAITTPVAGLTIWNTTNTQLEVYDGSYWKNMVGLLVSPLNVGDTYGGGKVFYIFGPSDNGFIKGQTHGLIAATVDQTTDAGVKWFPDKFYGVTGTYIGLGLPNTLAIITSALVTGTTNMSSFAAGLANSYRGGGYIDWFLPSKDELNLLYQAKDSIGGFATTGHPTYWSSTQKGTINLKDFASFVKGVESARTQFFFTTTGPDGKVAGTQSDLGIDNPRRVRAIRIF